MQIAHFLLLGLIILCPILAISDDLMIESIFLLWTAVALGVAAWGLSAADLAFLISSTRIFLLAAFVLAIWFLLQVMPALPGIPIHSIWTATSEALRQSVPGHISIDPGATALALAFYLLLIGIVILTTILSIDRRKATHILISATCASVFLACLAVARFFSDPGSFVLDHSHFDEAIDSACLGLIFSAACLCMFYERHETRPHSPSRQGAPFALQMLFGAFAFVICVVAIALQYSGSLFFAAIVGIGGFLSVICVRRLSLGRLGAGAIAATSSIIALVLIAGAAGQADPRLAFVRKDPASLALTQRLLDDTPFLGTGSGSLPSLMSIYHFRVPGGEKAEVVTAAARFSIEMGRPALWLALVAASLSAIVLLRGAWRRGRDSFYATAGAAGIAILTILAFVNNGLFGSSLLVLAAVLFGLALAQRTSRFST